MNEHTTDGPPTARSVDRSDSPLGRGLEDVSHLFLSRRPGEVAAGDEASRRPADRPGPSPLSGGGIAVLRPVSLTRDRLAATLMELDGALEEGLRTIDVGIPCPPCGEIDLLAVDRASQLAVVDFDTALNDGLLLRGVGHFDWLVRNMPNVRRMYREHAINFSLPPRLFLLAPQFSPLLRSVARQITRPRIHWVRYHTVDAAGGPGILFEPLAAD